MFYVIYIFNSILKIFPIARKTEFAFTEYWPLKKIAHSHPCVSLPLLYFWMRTDLFHGFKMLGAGRYKRDILISIFLPENRRQKLPWVRCSSCTRRKKKKKIFFFLKKTWLWCQRQENSVQIDLVQIILTLLKPLAISHSLIFHTFLSSLNLI